MMGLAYPSEVAYSLRSIPHSAFTTWKNGSGPVYIDLFEDIRTCCTPSFRIKTRQDTYENVYQSVGGLIVENSLAAA